jgi:hypothetical protein
MNFPNAKLLTYEHRNNFWGNNGFRYGSTISLSINGYILDLSNTSGVKDVFQACKLLSDSLGSYQDIVIDSINYGRGKITSVSFDSGNWVRVTEYTASIEIISEGNLENGNSYTDPDFSNSIVQNIANNAQYLEEFNEGYSIDYSSNEDGISGTHSIDIKLSSLFNGDKIEFAKNLASLIFSKTIAEDLSKLAYSKPEESLRKDYYSENYDSINGKCGFRRNFSYSNEASCYSKQRSITVNLGEDGITTVTESNSIRGECENPTLFDSAELGFASEIVGAYSRCNDAYNSYKVSFEINGDLLDKEMERSVKRNKFTGEIEYNIVFTNDKRRKGLYTFEYVLDLSRSEDFIWSAVENGSVNGHGTVGSDEKFKNAVDGWAIENPSIESRVQGFYDSNASIKPALPVLKLINKNLTRAPYDGIVSYSWSYTDDLTLDMSSEIRRKNVEISDSYATQIHNDFLIPGDVAKYSLAQPTLQSKQGERDVVGNLEICSQGFLFNGRRYLQDSFAIATGYMTTGIDTYLESFSFSSDEIEQNIQFNAKYKYSKAAARF